MDATVEMTFYIACVLGFWVFVCYLQDSLYERKRHNIWLMKISEQLGRANQQAKKESQA